MYGCVRLCKVVYGCVYRVLTSLNVSFLLLLLPLLHKGSGDSWCVDRDNGMEDKATGLRGGPITQGQRFVMYEVGEHQLRGNALHLGKKPSYYTLNTPSKPYMHLRTPFIHVYTPYIHI